MHKLALWLEQHDIPMSHFAERVGVTHAQLSRVLNEKRRPSWELMSRIKEATKGAVTPDDFFVTSNTDAA